MMRAELDLAMPKIIKSPTKTPVSSKRIITREVVSAKQTAKDIIEQAKLEASIILKQTQAQIEIEKKRGFAIGYRKAVNQYTKKLTQSLIRLKQAENSLEGDYVLLIKACVEKVLRCELSQSPSIIVDIVRATLSEVQCQREVILYVHPMDRNILDERRSQLLEALGQIRIFKIKSDPALKRGECVIYTEAGSIHSLLEQQLDAIDQAVKAELATSFNT